MEMEKEKIEEFYDDYVGKQKKTGINLRHRTIKKRAKEFGLNTNSNVLEIGCGVGTLTELLCDVVKNGNVVAVDISPESVASAKARLASASNLECLVSDMSDFKHDLKFDYFILPDVLEHIPVEQHAALFKTMRAHSKDTSKILINIPDPKYLEYVTIHKPELLQVIDQPLHTDELLRNAYASGFYLEYLEAYPLFHHQNDYQFICFGVNVDYKELSKPSKVKMKIRDIISKFY